MTFQYANTPTLAQDVLTMLCDGRSFSEIAAEICDREDLHILIENPYRQKIYAYKWTSANSQSISLENEQLLNDTFSAVFKEAKHSCGQVVSGVVYAPVVSEGKAESILFLQYKFPYTDEQAILMAENLARIYLYGRPDSNSDTQRSHFITDRVARDLLLYTVRDDSNGSIYFKNIKSSFPRFAPPFTILTFAADSEEALEQAYSQVSINYPNSFQLYKDSRIYVFLYALNLEKSKQSVLLGNSLRNFCSYYSLRCGVSQPFEFIENRNWYRRQSKHALLSASDENPVCFASARHLDVILSGILSRYEHNLFDFTAVQEIQKYDSENDTELLRTLECYLDHFNHPARTAAELFIDRSSLKHRLAQIKRIIHCDIDDIETAEKLRIAIRVHRTYEEMSRQKRCQITMGIE